MCKHSERPQGSSMGMMSVGKAVSMNAEINIAVWAILELQLQTPSYHQSSCKSAQFQNKYPNRSALDFDIYKITLKCPKRDFNQIVLDLLQE